jgi:hypothetical protein
MQGVKSSDDYFNVKKDSTIKFEFSSLQKFILVVRMLAYGLSFC